MASSTRGPRSRKRRADPGQLNLFDVPGEASAPRPLASAPFRARSKRANREIGAPRILTPQEAAQYLNVAVSTLKSWRAKKIGPAWRRRGARLVFYFQEDLDAFLRRDTRGRD